MKARLAALVAAVVLIGGAFVARSAFDDATDPTVVHCERVLMEACIDTFGEDRVVGTSAGATLGELVEAEEAGDIVWVTTTTFADILEAERAREGLSDLGLARTDGIAHTPLVLLADDDVDCATFECVDDIPRLGIDSLDTSPGLVAYGAIVAAELGRTDFATNDLDTSAFNGWRFAPTFESESRSAGSTYVVARGTYDAAITTEAEVATDFANPPDFVELDAVLVVTTLGIEASDLDDLRDALVADGWTAGDPPQPPARPNPGALEALRSG